jgi:hypothetical protein
MIDQLIELVPWLILTRNVSGPSVGLKAEPVALGLGGMYFSENVLHKNVKMFKENAFRVRGKKTHLESETRLGWQRFCTKKRKTVTTQ